MCVLDDMDTHATAKKKEGLVFRKSERRPGERMRCQQSHPRAFQWIPTEQDLDGFR